MFTAIGRTRRTAGSAKSTTLLIAVLVLANLAAIMGLGTTARAGGFPDALHYAPMTWEKMTWEKEAPLRSVDTQADENSAASVVVDPVARADIGPIAPKINRNFVEVSSEETAPTAKAIGRAGDQHRALLIALMTAALATMAGVSVLMFRTLAREIAETERKRLRF
ncbi:MAG: hypothetical protein CL535_17595 [Ahrensia sp.]|nr:hypothetical protein [Ahrensia sp.]|tara:strand:+ start:9663 stop:10160 length:498 start_codon:yes stop_codon:yes gene_type:complete